MTTPEDNNTPPQIELEFQNLEFTNTSDDPNVKIDIPNDPLLLDGHEVPLSTSPIPTTQSTSQQNNQPTPQTTAKFWTIEFYQPYFNITTKDITLRMVKSLFPFQGDFISTIRLNPDLWGPFWIVTSLIICLVITSNIGGLLKWFQAPLEYKKISAVEAFQKSSVGASVIYSFSFCIPALLWMFSKYKGINLSLLEYICVYGYSFTSVIPATLLCMMNYEWVRYFSLFIGFGYSITMILVSLFGEWNAKLVGPERIFLFILIIGCISAHLVLTFFVKLYFYTYWTQ